MSSVLPARPVPEQWRAVAATHWPVLLGLILLYGPTYWRLAHTVWQTEEQGHGPIILAVVAYLVWSKRAALRSSAGPPAATSGGALLALGLAAYVLGRSQDIPFLEVGSQLPVFAGALLALAGRPALRQLWFPLAFLVFMIPLPGALIDALTVPLKQHVSAIAEQLLYAAGYPIGRNGVVLVVGPYQLLVADACSGLNSMFSLLALGVLYAYLVKRPQRWWNALLVASAVPIAFVANIVRVLVLVLVTYHLGDEAGQGLVHEAAGMLLFLVALTLLLALDGTIALVHRALARRSGP